MIIRELVHMKELTILKAFKGCYTTMDGVNEQIDLGTGGAIQLPNPFSVASWTIWFKNTGPTLLFRGYNGGPANGFFLHGVPPGVPYRIVFPNQDGPLLSVSRAYSGSQGSLDDGEWHNITCVFDSTATRLDFYADGVLSNGLLTRTPNTPVVSNSTLNTVGFPSTAQDISQYGVWNRALSSIEVLDIYTRGRYSKSYADIPNLTYHLIANIIDPVDEVLAQPATSDNMDITNIICE